MRFLLWIRWHAYLRDRDHWVRKAIRERGYYTGPPHLGFRQWQHWREEIRARRIEERARR